MSVSPDIIVTEARYLLANSEVVTLRRCNELHAAIPVYTCDKYPSHRWYSGGWVVKPCPNFYDYYPEDDPNWVACPDLYAVRAATFDEAYGNDLKNAATEVAAWPEWKKGEIGNA